LVKDVDVRRVAVMDAIDGEQETALPVGWDTIDDE
jgi:hypothetical protein